MSQDESTSFYASLRGRHLITTWTLNLSVYYPGFIANKE